MKYGSKPHKPLFQVAKGTETGVGDVSPCLWRKQLFPRGNEGEGR